MSPSTRLLALLMAAATLACGGPGSIPEPAPPGGALPVMSFNIRYGTAEDGGHAWPLRRAGALYVIRAFDPAVLGLQEALRFQLDELAEALPHMGEVGVGRDDGREAGEYAAILYDRRRLEVLASGTAWLSDTPEVPGSADWGNRIPRVVTWAHLRNRFNGSAFYVFNTHWDHESQASRERSAAFLLDLVGRRATPDPFLVLGDFNAGEQNPAFRALVAGSEATGPLQDAYRLIHTDTTGVGTYHGFLGVRTGERIDAVLVSRGWEVVDADIVRTYLAGPGGARYPSDHFPVTAVVRRAPAAQPSGNTLGSTSRTTTTNTSAMGSPTRR